MLKKSHKTLNIKSEIKDEIMGELKKQRESMPPPPPLPIHPHVKFLPAESEVSYAGEEDDGDENVFEDPVDFREELETTRSNNPAVYQDFMEQYPDISRYYVEKFLGDESDIEKGKIKYDNLTGSWEIGSVPMAFQKDGNIKIGDVIYQGTHGLYRLLFLKDPGTYTQNEADNFRDILENTQLYKDSSGRIKGNRSAKYTQIIKPLVSDSATTAASKLRKPSTKSSLLLRTKSMPSSFSSQTATKTGKALIEYNQNSDIIHYDDINELVERFKKLEGSRLAGNNNSIGEIRKILRELSRLGIIEFY